MKAFVWWMLSISIGAAAGYALSFMLATHVYILIAAGVIVGNSVYITALIHKSNESIPFDEEDAEE